MWARPQPAFRWLLSALCALAFVFAMSLTPTANAQEAIPVAPGGEAAPAIAEPPAAPVQQADPVPVQVDPAPQPQPQPEPAPEAQAPPEAPAAPVDEHPQTVPPRGGDGGNRDAPAHDTPATFQTAPATTSAGPQAPATPTASADPIPVTTAPLGWDVYDDALFAETLGDGGGVDGSRNGLPEAISTFGALEAIGAAAERDKQRDAEPVSRADPMSAGGSGSGGSGPGPGKSLGLFGAAGGSSAGMALITLLGMACGWFLLAPDPKRAFLTSTATWRPSAYVPPIERPG
jgi:hypothetical protein